MSNDPVVAIVGVTGAVGAEFIATMDKRGFRVGKLKAPDDQLFTGEFWSGVRGLELGLVDALGDIHETLRTRFGDDVRTRVIEPRRGLFRLPSFGLMAADLAAAVEDRALWTRLGL